MQLLAETAPQRHLQKTQPKFCLKVIVDTTQ